jgi:hypothetical protein
VRFNDVERDNVEEYSVSEGWIRVQAGKARDRRGNPMTIRSRARSSVFPGNEAGISAAPDPGVDPFPAERI